MGVGDAPGGGPRNHQALARIERRIFHLVAGSIFPIALLFAPETPLLIAAIVLAGGAVLGEALRFRVQAFNRWLTRTVRPLMKEGEHATPFASTYLLIATAIIVGTMSAPVAALALFYLSIGDPVAAMVGQRFGAGRLFGKSLEGSSAFLAAALAIGALLLATELDTTYSVMVVGACAAMLAELAPMRLDDNLKVPLAAGGVMTLTAHFWG
ncbi:MAG: hypothetical protein V3V35_11450 [Dehalococcoidia bacterium]